MEGMENFQPVLVEFDFTGTRAQYDKTWEDLVEKSGLDFSNVMLHLSADVNGELKIWDVWPSPEFEAMFVENVLPHITATGATITWKMHPVVRALSGGMKF